MTTGTVLWLIVIVILLILLLIGAIKTVRTVKDAIIYFGMIAAAVSIGLVAFALGAMFLTWMGTWTH